MLRQLEWRLQNGPITKSGVLPATTLFFWKICSSFRTSKELIWCTNDPNVYIRIFRKRWSLILGWFFPVPTILNLIKFIVSNKFDIIYSKIWHNFCLIISAWSSFEKIGCVLFQINLTKKSQYKLKSPRVQKKIWK